MTSPTEHQCTLAVLAGGRGSRMGAAKDRLVIAGRPVLQHLLERLSFSGPTLLVTSAARPRPVGADAFGRVVLDGVEGAGPTAGILAALNAATTPTVVVLSCDMPNIARGHVDWLIHEFGRATPQTMGMMCRRQDGTATRIEPFPGIYRAEAVREITLGGSLRALLDGPRFVAVDTPPSWPTETWINLNFPDDLTAIAGEIR
ncbi:molybdenum cofactor guanylyltransferase [Humisphaera borealis]|uniref:Molybdenum cofactor guanylyltransferase n=1 Tax=Humisphaera borealis TaxID=2807512 RepID=A0A7M2WSI6_9BACT|nr:molybdenum cofactor guanylyltransferase [Humisphaera borealis]QOV88495.1 molybdenum cofactor guanylyltransferase [Humisphaera borealis]